MFEAVLTSILCLIGGIVGFFLGAFLNDPVGGAIFGAVVIGAGCIVRAINARHEQ